MKASSKNVTRVIVPRQLGCAHVLELRLRRGRAGNHEQQAWKDRSEMSVTLPRSNREAL
jgi:hypothetical protein